MPLPTSNFPPFRCAFLTSFYGADATKFREKRMRVSGDCRGGTIFIADAHRGDIQRFVVRADEKLTAFLELERITHELAVSACLGHDSNYDQAAPLGLESF